MDNSTLASSGPSTFTSSRNRNRNLQQFLKKPVFIPILIGVLLAVGILVFTLRSVGSAEPVIGRSDTKIEIAAAKSTQKLNKEFSFPLKNDAGKEVSKVKYQIESAEIRDELVVKGQRARSIKGREFLVLNIKFTNDFNQPIDITSRDYVRLIVNDTKERIAADIHNDPIQVQPISTKTTRLAFPINEKDDNLKIQVGEINGKKEVITLQLN